MSGMSLQLLTVQALLSEKKKKVNQMCFDNAKMKRKKIILIHSKIKINEKIESKKS